jgi:nucleotide-binding universal stress UspA family protein
VIAVVDWREVPSALLRPRQAASQAEIRGAVRTWIEGRVEEASEKLSRKGFKASPEVLLGDPVHVLLKAAKAWRADAIFIGSRGLNAVDRFLLGSVSGAVAAKAPCSVEVIRGPRAPGGKRKPG